MTYSQRMDVISMQICISCFVQILPFLKTRYFISSVPPGGTKNFGDGQKNHARKV